MNATKTSFQREPGTLVWNEMQANGSAPALKWTDASNVDWRAIACYQFDSSLENYTILVSKYLKIPGTNEWVLQKEYQIISDYTKYRKLSTGELLPPDPDNGGPPVGVPAALDINGNIVDANGWVYNAKYFTILLGYGNVAAPVGYSSINSWVYLEIADAEGLTIVP